MRRLIAFINVSLDGYFADNNDDISWAHRGHQDAEWNAFVQHNAGGGGALLFGRVTYDMMAGFWPTPFAIESQPVVAERMNALPKYVFSRTLSAVTWNNTTLIKGDLPEETRTLKETPGPDMAILGSGSIVSQLTQAGLIDEVQIVVNPVVLGQGKPLFTGVRNRFSLKLLNTRRFGNGNVVLSYGCPGG